LIVVNRKSNHFEERKNLSKKFFSRQRSFPSPQKKSERNSQSQLPLIWCPHPLPTPTWLTTLLYTKRRKSNFDEFRKSMSEMEKEEQLEKK